MKRGDWGWTLLIGGVVLVVAGWLIFGFLAEPSAVGRMRTALVGIGIGLIVVGAVGGVAGLWMLLRRRT